jgi:hypothetical protein
VVLPEFPHDAIEMDYDTCVDLGICTTSAPSRRCTGNEPPFFPCELRVRPARRWEMLRAHWRHPNPAYRRAVLPAYEALRKTTPKPSR